MGFLDAIGITTLVTKLKDYFATKHELSSKQDTLVSGTNLATINSRSLLNGGNIVIPVTGLAFCNCYSSAGVQDKTLGYPDGDALDLCKIIFVKFSYGNTYTSGVLKLNGKNVRVNNAITSSTNTLTWNNNDTLMFYRVLGNEWEYFGKQATS